MNSQGGHLLLRYTHYLCNVCISVVLSNILKLEPHNLKYVNSQLGAIKAFKPGAVMHSWDFSLLTVDNIWVEYAQFNVSILFFQ